MLEHALQLRRGYLRPENIDALAKQFRQLSQKTYRAKAASIRYFGGIQSRGAGSFLYGLTSKREQRSVIKIAYAKNTKTRAWAAHGDYLQRHHAQAEHKKGIGFNAQQAEIDITETLREWQSAGDPHFFKLIIAPENAERLDLRRHIMDLMQTAERDLKSSLEWVAIDHHDTDHAHLHVLIRGVDQQKNPLVIDPLYIAEGFRQRSQTLATNVLGLRTRQDFSLARQREIDKTRFTTIDRSLLAQSKNNIVSYETPIPTSPV